MKVFCSSDHAGFELKKILVQYLEQCGYDVTDCGPDVFESSDDYPVSIIQAIRHASTSGHSRAIIIGGSGTGEAVVANRFPGVRAAVYYGGPLDIIRLSREHNDTNVLSLGARFISYEEAKEAVKLWLETPFTAEERHVRRIAQIEEVTRS